eukprot:TRINITY_DN10750_c0_g1_i1.p1 TRINITY_DN10750_c0_g1~~TRINITY_DN10750_c0_g1_i1.p1  ORF type:complete len:440 (-),score=64.05 TRINITY_DN10750_c0_g1_i1:101-1420(-)
MKLLMMLLFLFCPSFTEASSCEVQEKFQNAVGAIGAAVGEIPILSTAVNLADVYLDNVGGDDCSLTKREIENLIDEKNRVQEKQQADSQLEGIVREMKSILSRNNIRRDYDKLEKLRSDLATMRRKFFDEASYVKFDVFTIYGNTELVLTEFLIQQHKSDQDLQEENFGRALIYYIKTASDWNLEYIMGQEDAGRMKNLYAAKNLKPALIKWMEMMSNNKKISKRVQTASKFDIFDSAGNIDWWNVNDKHGSSKEKGIRRAGLPIPIENDTWVSLKCGPCGRWISCWDSIKEDEYCSLKNCPGVYGNIKDGLCVGEKFKIESTSGGFIKYGSYVAFKYWYWKCDKGRGKGHYWLSRWDNDESICGRKGTNLYTRTCPGNFFSTSDVKKCKNEQFILSWWADGEPLRNGDYAALDTKKTNSHTFSCHIMTQFLEKGDKTC